ncbi:MAG: tRNA (N(6)-L-threonylcarbamoyladenosine(37)-C(2))-methylthiotransferase MtaB [Dehalococcoidales bacterium]|nr:tRNA (N(6)-L-threonylcarbamoyladenosine(37)-C(2))-methylthiotransferase MtaB [Dehalococcoidales bacterium]
MNQNQKDVRIALDTLGCKLNQAETEYLSKQFIDAGYTMVSSSDNADVYILNTCTVTRIADRKSRQWLRSAHRRNPDALLVATGCYAERASEDIYRIDGVDLVLDNNQKPYLLQILENSGYLSRTTHVQSDISDAYYDSFKTRSFIKIQDGCNNFCSYCIVPLVRKEEKSLPVKQIIAEINRQIDNGYKEIVLTGVKIGSYYYEGYNLKKLIECILTETTILRLRLSSLQPQEIAHELINLWDNKRLCPHFHLSLQSGSNSVLNRMKRQYTASDYLQSVALIRTIVPDAAITTDVIIGFPGETEAEFNDNYQFCQDIGFSRIHVFSFSSREGTQASLMFEKVEDKIKKQRSQKMLALAEQSGQNFNKNFLGRVMPVLWEKQTNKIWSGLTDNYIRIYTKSKQDLTNEILPVELREIKGNGIWGKVSE